MNLTIKTSEFQDMVGKASKCVSNNKLIPLTSLINVKVESNFLTLTTTDATNYFYAHKVDKVDCEDFEISVLADTFTKLIQKTTSDTITLIVEGSLLKIKGNGTYTMELPLDENGSIIKFPKKLNDDFRIIEKDIKLSTVKNILTSNKASLSTSMDYPSLTCYYCGDKVVTSDRKKICKNAIEVFNNPMLITPTLMELLGILDEETIEVSKNSDNVIFSTSKDTVYAPITDGVDTFPVDAIDGLINQSFKSMCKVSRSAVMNVLDRLSLFVVPYDKHGIYLTFTSEGIMFSSKKSSGQELIPYTSSIDFEPYTCCIDIEMLKSQIATQDADEIQMYYGADVAIKLVNKNITQVIALLVDDRMEA